MPVWVVTSTAMRQSPRALFGTSIPSRFVSGDHYQAIERHAGSELFLMTSDVSGHGVAAAILTASLEALSAVPIEAGAPGLEPESPSSPTSVDPVEHPR